MASAAELNAITCVGAYVYDYGSEQQLGVGTPRFGKDPNGDQDDTGYILWWAMMAMGPFSPKLSIVWMLLIGSLGALLRGEQDAIVRSSLAARAPFHARASRLQFTPPFPRLRRRPSRGA